MTHNFDIFMSGKVVWLNGLTLSQWSKVKANKWKLVPVITYVFDSGLLGTHPGIVQHTSVVKQLCTGVCVYTVKTNNNNTKIRKLWSKQIYQDVSNFKPLPEI